MGAKLGASAFFAIGHAPKVTIVDLENYEIAACYCAVPELAWRPIPLERLGAFCL